MKLRTIKPTLVFLFGNSKTLEKPIDATLSDCGDVMTWHFMRWIKENELNFPDFTRIEFVATSEEVGGGIYISDPPSPTGYVRIPFDKELIERVKRATQDTEIYELLFYLIRQGIPELEKAYGQELSTLYDALQAFEANGRYVQATLVSRTIRGTGLRLRVDGHMNSDVLNIYFVVEHKKTEIYRELIQNSVPSPTFLYRRFKKIQFDGEKIYLDDNLYQPVLPWRRIQPGDALGDHIKHYNWSISLDDLLELIPR